jgi:hypothetical protein
MTKGSNVWSLEFGYWILNGIWCLMLVISATESGGLGVWPTAGAEGMDIINN